MDHEADHKRLEDEGDDDGADEGYEKGTAIVEHRDDTSDGDNARGHIGPARIGWRTLCFICISG
jgi:hypothetical protein